MADKRNKNRMSEQYIQCIKGYILEHGYAPSYREIGAMLGKASTSTVFTQMQKLFDMGWLETDMEYLSPRAYRIGQAYYDRNKEDKQNEFT